MSYVHISELKGHQGADRASVGIIHLFPVVQIPLRFTYVNKLHAYPCSAPSARHAIVHGTNKADKK